MSSIDPTHSTSIRALATHANYSTQALQAIVRISLADGPAQLLDKLMDATAAIGAAASVYTASIPEDGHEPSCLSLFACHPAFWQEEINRGSMLQHPWFRFASKRSTPGTDHQIPPQHEADVAAMDLARGYGFRSCLVVPTSSGHKLDRMEMLCLGSDKADDFEGAEARIVRALAQSLAAELHDWLTNYLQCQLREDAQLHDKDIALLALEWQGLSTKEISQRTGLSGSSVDSRFQRINARLNCASRKASARRAAAYGLLESM